MMHIPPTADPLEIAGLCTSALALGAWLVVLSLGVGDEVSRRRKGLNGLLRIQSYSNLSWYVGSTIMAATSTVPFWFLVQIPYTNPEGDPVRASAIVATRLALIVIAGVLFAKAVISIVVREWLDRYRSSHGPYDRRRTDQAATEGAA